jgi:hypothetical protein
MKKMFVAALLLFLFTSEIFSQKSQAKNSYLTLSAGPSFPIGDFASKDLLSDKSGFAAVGQSLNISYTKISLNKIGFSIELRGQRNPVDVKAMEESLNKSVFATGFWASNGGMPPPQIPGTTFSNWNVKKNSWYAGSAMGGICAEVPLGSSKKTTFNAKLLVGGVFVKSPGIEANSNTDTTTAHLEQNSEYAFGFISTVGAGFHFNINKKLFFLAEANYTGTNKLSFDNIESKFRSTKGESGTPDYSVSVAQTTADGRQVLTVVNVNVGIGLRL